MIAGLGARLRAGDPDVVDWVIGAAPEKLAAVPADHPERAAALDTYGLALIRRFERDRRREDLDAAIDAVGEAVTAATAVADPDRPGYLSNLSNALQVRFEVAGADADLAAAIDAGREGAASAPPGHPDRPALSVALGVALKLRFERTGAAADADEAIRLLREVLRATPEGHAARPARLSDLGALLRARFARTREGADLEQAIGVLREAVDAASADRHRRHPGIGAMLTNLANALTMRFQRTPNRADLDEAIAAGTAAVNAAPAGSPERPGRLSSLAVAHRMRFELTDDPAELDTAVSSFREAVAAAPRDHPAVAGFRNNLAGALARRFERAGEPGDLGDIDEAVRAHRSAVEAVPADHPDRALYLIGTGLALRSRFERVGVATDLDAAGEAFRQAAAVSTAPARTRVLAARHQGRTAATARRWEDAADGYAAAVELIGLVAPRGLARADQEHLLDELEGLASDAAACCVRAGSAGRALTLVEQSRGVLLAQALDARTDLTALTVEHHDLARRFVELRDQLDETAPAPGGRGEVDPSAADVDLRRAKAGEFTALIGEIRGLRGFEGFLRPPGLAELLGAAARGPVVVVTVSEFGSYALIVTGRGVTSLPLPGLTPGRLREQVQGFLAALADVATADVATVGAPAELRLTEVLAWLWDVLAGPALDRIRTLASEPGVAGEAGGPGSGRPRVWWCATGLLSFLPLHAAGYHRADETHRADSVLARTVVDRVVSSYTPTVRALTHARRPHRDGRAEDGSAGGAERVLAVAMPTTWKQRDLPGAELEAQDLKARFPGRVTVLAGAEATHEAVRTAMRAAPWAHFACHGHVDAEDPSASCLLVADYRTRRLSVVDVSRLRLDDARLAYLSACSTARPGDRLADEAIHLAAAFQLAGYRHVIATLWPIVDVHAAVIADHVYDLLAPTGGASGPGDVAEAVHTAVLACRRRSPDQPSVWASHIHSGA